MTIYLRLFLSFMKIGFSSFGGMTMIPIINEEVRRYHWLTSAQIMDIVAIAEMTPGSLGINCATFTGMRTAGILGAVCATLGVITPSLSLGLLVAIFIGRFRGNRWLESALKEIRPVSMGMLLAAAVNAGIVFFDNSYIAWNRIFISAAVFLFIKKCGMSIPNAILLAILLGLLLGY